MDSARIQALFAQSLAGDHDSEEAWAAVRALRSDPSREILERAADWCRSDEPAKRRRAADILAQLQRVRLTSVPRTAPEPMFRDEAYALVTRMLRHEQDPSVLHSAIVALGHLSNPEAIPLVVRYHDHPDDGVRFAAAFALGCFSNQPPAIDALIRLTTDSCSDVRDWAVFGLGVCGDADSPEIRDALVRCVEDTNADVREEAAVGLGRRRDPRLVPHLLAMLEGAELSVRVEEAAAALLALPEMPRDWRSANYRDAIQCEFGQQD